MSRFPYSTPEAQGVSSTAIHNFVAALERDVEAVHSLMLLRHGHVIAEGWWEPFRRDDPHALFSLSKSFTSSAIGLLITEGRLSLDDPVLKFFPDETPARVSEHLRAMRVRHLLSMSTGHETEPSLRTRAQTLKSWVRAFLTHPVKYEPGTHFLYNSMATYVLSAIVTQVTGERTVDYLRPRLFEPLGIQSPFWEVSPQLINTGGWGLHITTEDIAAFGQLYLQKGLWRGQQLMPESWVETATRWQVSNGDDPNNDWAQGYGYQFWRCRHNLYRGDGAFGQYCIVMPEQDAVLVMTSGLGDMGKPMALAWEHLLPAFQSAPLLDDSAAQSALTRKLASLQLTTPQGAISVGLAGSISGRTYQMAANPDRLKSLCFEFGADETVITFGKGKTPQRLTFGHGRWVRGSAILHPRDAAFVGLVIMRPGAWPLAASGTWTDESTFTAKLWWYETPFAWTMTCRFSDDQVTIEQRGNVGFSPVEGPTLHGVLSQK